MKIVIGKDPNSTFRVFGNSGMDLTDELSVKSVEITASATDATLARLSVYADVEIDAEEVVFETSMEETDSDG